MLWLRLFCSPTLIYKTSTANVMLVDTPTRLQMSCAHGDVICHTEVDSQMQGVACATVSPRQVPLLFPSFSALHMQLTSYTFGNKTVLIPSTWVSKVDAWSIPPPRGTLLYPLVWL